MGLSAHCAACSACEGRHHLQQGDSCCRRRRFWRARRRRRRTCPGGFLPHRHAIVSPVARHDPVSDHGNQGAPSNNGQPQRSTDVVPESWSPATAHHRKSNALALSTSSIAVYPPAAAQYGRRPRNLHVARTCLRPSDPRVECMGVTVSPHVTPRITYRGRNGAIGARAAHRRPGCNGAAPLCCVPPCASGSGGGWCCQGCTWSRKNQNGRRGPQTEGRASSWCHRFSSGKQPRAAPRRTPGAGLGVGHGYVCACRQRDAQAAQPAAPHGVRRRGARRGGVCGVHAHAGGGGVRPAWLWVALRVWYKD